MFSLHLTFLHGVSSLDTRGALTPRPLNAPKVECYYFSRAYGYIYFCWDG
jgi:hypothetical protein